MRDIKPKKEPNIEDGGQQYVMMMKDRKSICRCLCTGLPTDMKKVWNIHIIPVGVSVDLCGLPSCSLLRAPEDSRQDNEWKVFFRFLQEWKKVAEVDLDDYKLYIHPPEGSILSHATMVYKKKDLTCQYDNQRIERLGECLLLDISKLSIEHLGDGCGHLICRVLPCQRLNVDPDYEFIGAKNSEGLTSETNLQLRDTKSYISVHPSYLKTLGQAHSGWIFGAIAELVDNSRDAKATELKISIEMIYSKAVRKDIPMLSLVDDGQGMTHQEIKQMISFGHKLQEADDPDRIGKFGIGFKSGAMRLGKDALVLTQTADSRSIAFLSQTLNEGKDNLEIPIVTFRRIGQYMEMDTNIQDAALSTLNFRAIKKFSPFNEYLIGQKTGLFTGKCTGTQIYIWNLDEWGSNYSLEWEDGISGKSSYHDGDIKVRSARVRSRPGQMGLQVQLDYSLRAYLEVIFFDPRMKIYIQGGLVKSRPLAKTLHRTVVEKDKVMKKPVQLTIGRCQLEWERANCGIFLYWHGRLIEAYKRVGTMKHNGDRGRGVIGVIDVTELMKSDQGHVWVHNNKQAFQDCEEYAELEKWLGEVTDGYIDKHDDMIPLKKGTALYKPDIDWVQCDKCRKWRMLTTGFAVESLPDEWFCYMDPFNGKCEVPEEKVERGVINISEKRSRSIWEDQSRHEDKSPEMSEQTARKRQSGVSGSNNDVTPGRSRVGDLLHTHTPRRRGQLKVTWSDSDISPPEQNAGGGASQTPSRRRRFRKRRRNCIENSPSGSKASWPL